MLTLREKIKYDKRTKRMFLLSIVAVLVIALIACVIVVANRSEYKVTFYSDNNTVLKVDNVKKNASAVPPNEPQMTYGKIFTSWDTDFFKVKKTLNIHPICEDVKGRKNVFAISGAYGHKGDFVYIPVSLCGDVCASGFDITITYDADSLFVEEIIDEDDAVVVNNEIPGKLRINYVSTKNTTADVDICKLKCTVAADEGMIPVALEVNQVYAFEDSDDLQNDKMLKPESESISANVYVIP